MLTFKTFFTIALWMSVRFCEGGNASWSLHPSRMTSMLKEAHSSPVSVKRNHSYYTSSVLHLFGLRHSLWFDYESLGSHLLRRGALSGSHEHLNLNFSFPFFDSSVSSLWVSRKGFVSTAAMPSFVMSTRKSNVTDHYIAPLMADFGQGFVTFYEMANNELVVRWEDMVLEGQPEFGAYSFQLTIEKSGSIFFVYHTLPQPIFFIEQNEHEVEVGVDGGHAFGKVDLVHADIDSDTTIILTPDICRKHQNCFVCISNNCNWCDDGCVESSSSSSSCLGAADSPACPLNNDKRIVSDDHNYYIKHVYVADESAVSKYYEDLGSHGSARSLLTAHSESKAEIVYMEPNFRFYGHNLSHVYVTTDGFVSTAPLLHDQMDKAQYIAPLKADFNLDKVDVTVASIKNWTNASWDFVIEWSGLTLGNSSSNIRFQLILKSSGDVIFVYLSVPDLSSSSEMTSLLSGMADAYIMMSEGLMFVYHEMHVEKRLVLNNTVVVFEAKKTCNLFNSCHTCTKANTDFDCVWCPAAALCSSGFDRNRDSWTTHNCHLLNITGVETSKCSLVESEWQLAGPYNEYNVSRTNVEHNNVTWLESPLLRKVPFNRGGRFRLSFPFPLLTSGPVSVLYLLPNRLCLSLRRGRNGKSCNIAPLSTRVPRPPVYTSVRVMHDRHRLVVQWRLSSMRCHLTRPVGIQVTLHERGDINILFDHDPTCLLHHNDDDDDDELLTFVRRGDRVAHVSFWASLLSQISIITFVPTQPPRECSKEPTCRACLRTANDDRGDTKCAWCVDDQRCGHVVEASRNAMRALWRRGQGCSTWLRTSCPASHSNTSAASSSSSSSSSSVYYTVEMGNSSSFSHYYVPDMLRTGIRLTRSSNNFRQMDEVELDFVFPFYGHWIQRLLVVGSGFVAIPSATHDLLAESQYVAPLMANFDPSINSQSLVLFKCNETWAVIEWRQLRLKNQEPPSNHSLSQSEFTFQLQISEQGDLVFVYVSLPSDLSGPALSDDEHPVKIGVSEAFINEHSIVQPLHTLNLLSLRDTLHNQTVVVLRPGHTCTALRTCWQCTAATANVEGLRCVWCPALKRCSDGRDRLRNTWKSAGCFLAQNTIEESQLCPMETVSSPNRFYDQHVSWASHSVFSKDTTKTKVCLNSTTTTIIETERPIVFFGLSFHLLRIWPQGYVQLMEKEHEDVIRHVVAPMGINHRLVCSKMAFDSTEKDDLVFMVQWLFDESSVNKEYAVHFMANGSVLIHYLSLSSKANQVNSFALMASTLVALNETISRKTAFREEMSHLHLKQGLKILFQPRKWMTCARTSECSACISQSCHYCHTLNTCQAFVEQCPESSHNHLQCLLRTKPVFIICLTLITLVSMIATVYVMASKRPASCPGQILLKARMTHYALLRGDQRRARRSNSQRYIINDEDDDRDYGDNGDIDEDMGANQAPTTPLRY